ncbi:MAG: hypothetical protein NTW15_04000 [Burkholderiales bacterium]|nr:hypothetical protein [Burkholderiales bacterium]
MPEKLVDFSVVEKSIFSIGSVCQPTAVRFMPPVGSDAFQVLSTFHRAVVFGGIRSEPASHRWPEGTVCSASATHGPGWRDWKYWYHLTMSPALASCVLFSVGEVDGPVTWPSSLTWLPMSVCACATPNRASPSAVARRAMDRALICMVGRPPAIRRRFRRSRRIRAR